MNESPETREAVVVECDLPHPPEKVWRALTEQDLLGAWLLPNDIRPEAGKQFVLQPTEDGATLHRVECEIIEATPHRRLSWRQREGDDDAMNADSIESVVTFELTELPGRRTHLRIVHDEFVRRAKHSTLHGGQLATCRAVVHIATRNRRSPARKPEVLCMAVALQRAA